MTGASGSGPAQARFEARVLFASPVLLAACFAALSASIVLARGLVALRDARTIRAGVELAAARLVAEQAAHAYVDSSGQRACTSVDLGRGLDISTSGSSEPGSGEVRLATRVADRRLEFAFARLPGSTSPVFDLRLVVASDAPPLPADWPPPAVVGRDDLPRLAVAAAPATPGPAAALLQRDPGIALTRLPAGTDRDDFVLGAGTLEPSADAAGAVQFVRGNLWVDRAPEPLRLSLPRDLTLVVAGNAYLGRSIKVAGPGRLTIATQVADGVAFADVDGNGRWSTGDQLRSDDAFSGPMEGAGAVYLGLPRDGAEHLCLDVGLVVGGVLHLAAERALVRGPVVLSFGGTVLPGRRGKLVVAGWSAPLHEPGLLPGFAAVGSPRPGPLRLRGGCEQPLYVAAPTR
jgi:hypothetical protein